MPDIYHFFYSENKLSEIKDLVEGEIQILKQSTGESDDKFVDRVSDIKGFVIICIEFIQNFYKNDPYYIEKWNNTTVGKNYVLSNKIADKRWKNGKGERTKLFTPSLAMIVQPEDWTNQRKGDPVPIITNAQLIDFGEEEYERVRQELEGGFEGGEKGWRGNIPKS